MKFKNFLLGTVAIFSSALLFIDEAKAGYPVTDAGVNSQASSMVAGIQTQVTMMTDVRNLNQQILGVIGNPGAQPFLATQTGWQQYYSGGGVLGQSLAQTKPKFCDIVACEVPTTSDVAQVESAFTDYSSAHTWVMRTFYNGKGQALNSNEKRDYAELRNRAVREAALHGYSLSMTSRNQLAATADKMTVLEGAVDNTDSLRSDIKANSMVSLASYHQQANLLALIASLVEIESSNALASDSSYIQPGGGQVPPDVFVESDYNASGQRIKISRQKTGAPIVVTTAQGKNNGGIIGNVIKGAGDPNSTSTQNIDNVLKNVDFSGNPIEAAGKIYKETIGNNVSSIFESVKPFVQIAERVARATGKSDIANKIGNLSSLAQAAGTRPSSIVYKGVDIIAERTGNTRLKTMVRLADNALDTRDPASLDNLIDVARDTARASGRHDLADMIRQTDQIRQKVGNNMQDPRVEQIVWNSTRVVAESTSQSDPDSAQVFASTTPPSSTEPAVINPFLFDIVKTVGRVTDNRTLEEIADITGDAADKFGLTKDTPAGSGQSVSRTAPVRNTETPTSQPIIPANRNIHLGSGRTPENPPVDKNYPNISKHPLRNFFDPDDLKEQIDYERENGLAPGAKLKPGLFSLD